MISLPIWVFVLLIVGCCGQIFFIIWWSICHYKDRKVYLEYLEEEYGDKNNGEEENK